MSNNFDRSDRGALITPQSLARISRAIGRLDSSRRNVAAARIRTAYGDGDPVRLGKTTAAWNKGTLATITLYEEGTPPNETPASPPVTLPGCVNKFANIAADKWVMLAVGTNGTHYVISAEC